jgi:hypothetical protein
MKINGMILSILFFCLITTGGGNTENNINVSSIPESTQNSPSPDSGVELSPIITSKPTSNNQGVALEKESDNMLGHYGNTQYFWRMEKDNCVLYSIDDSELYAKQIAIFPPMDSEYSDTDSSIINFGVCGDWLIASVGHYFYGDFVRLKKDGSELAHFYLTDDDTFVIIDDWIYYNYWANQDKPENDADGCYRIRPDGTEKEYLGDTIHNIYFFENGSIYGESSTSKTINGWNPVVDFIRCEPDGSKVVTLFKGDSLPKFENSDFIEYSNINIIKNYVMFTVSVHGQSDGDSWRGHYIYTADYSVKNDGSNLILLNEKTDK